MQLIALFVTPVPQLLLENPSHQKTEKSEDVLNRFGKFWLLNYAKISPTMMPKVILLFQPLMYEHKVLSMYDRRNGVGKPVFSQAPFGHEFNVIALGLCEPDISDDVPQQIVSDASNPAQNRTANV